MNEVVQTRWTRRLWLTASLLWLAGVAAADYLTGFELWFLFFYLVSVSVATWTTGWGAGLLLSVLSVGVSLAGDLASGARYANALVPWWNALIALSFYLAMVAALTFLRASRDQLERRVQERTRELRHEIAERERLERALLEVSEREQRRIGHDLHDSLCQHLTGTALAGQVLREKLVARDLDEARDAERLVGMVEDGIGLARSLARGLAPVELDTQGLMAALRELARTTSAHSPLSCRLDLPDPVLLNDPEATTQLFRIAQEAVRNAVRHSRGREVIIGLHQNRLGVRITIQDDGVGLSQVVPDSGGMGLSIMRHRAAMIGAAFAVECLERGTRVSVQTRELGAEPAAPQPGGAGAPGWEIPA